MCINYRYKYWYIILYSFLHSEKQYLRWGVSVCCWDHDTAVFVENVPSFHWYFSLIGSIWQYCSVFIVLCLSVCCFCKIFLAVLANALSGQVDILEHLELFAFLRTLHSVFCMKPPVCVSVEYTVWIVSICWAGVICSLYLLCSFDLSLEYHAYMNQ